MTNIIIVGAGIIGLSIARELILNKRGNVIILEKEHEAGMHASGRNSGVIHSGINQKPGSIKARMCVDGSLMLRNYCKEKSIPMNECGTIVIANNENQIKTLDKLMEMGTACGVSNLKFLSESELKEKEPNSSGIKALFSPNGAAVDSEKLVKTMALDVISLGGKILTGEKVVGISGLKVKTEKNEYTANHIINCAGLYADKVAHMMNEGLDFKVIPFRGEYMEVSNVSINSMIYQTPDLRFPFLSVHMTKETDGKIIAGPTAVLSFGRESYNKEINIKESFEFLTSLRFFLLVVQPGFFSMAFQAFKMSFSKYSFCKEIQKVSPRVIPGLIKPFRSGIRAQMVDKYGRFVDDHVVTFKKSYTNVLNCVSPGMTCSMAFAKYVNQNLIL
ncbi:MAG: FAD dependent oxidoreductase [uncultured bacterium]|nr:MAG: FAD dependent oxidoreductase [uncultured bacterium]